MTSGQLVELTLEQLIELREKYKLNWPKNEIGYNVLNNYIKWLQKDLYVESFHAYCLNGDYSDGTFVSLHTSYIFGDTLSDNQGRLTKALTLVDLDPRNHYRYFLREQIRPAVADFVEQRGLNVEKEWLFLRYYMAPEDGVKIKLPELPKGYTTKTLSEEDVTELNRYWVFNYPKSDIRLRALAKYNANIGVYTVSGKLAGWALRYEWGALALLQVHEEYQKQGIGTYLVKAMAKKIAEAGEYSYCTIVPGNIASIKVFESVGFQRNAFMRYFEIIPSTPITNGYAKE